MLIYGLYGNRTDTQEFPNKLYRLYASREKAQKEADLLNKFDEPFASKEYKYFVFELTVVE